MRRRRLGLAPNLFVERWDREGDRDARSASSLAEQVDVPDDHRTARDDAERVRGFSESLDAAAREAVAALGRLVRVSGRANRHPFALPRGTGELAAEHLGDVDLDADRCAVPVVRGPFGTLLESTDVTEGAAVHAAHVRIQGPLEPHPLHTVQRAPARLFSVLGPHQDIIEHTFVSTPDNWHTFGALLRKLRGYARRGWRVEAFPTQGGEVCADPSPILREDRVGRRPPA